MHLSWGKRVLDRRAKFKGPEVECTWCWKKITKEAGGAETEGGSLSGRREIRGARSGVRQGFISVLNSVRTLQRLIE